MRKTICLITICILVATTQADTDWYSGTNNVQEGDSYDNTYVWNDATVDMTGGTLLSLDLLNSSAAYISGGDITQGLYAWNDSTVDISGGTVGWNLNASDNSTVNLHGGTITDWLYATDNSLVNIHGYGFSYDPDGGDWNGGQLTGFWVDDSALTIDFLDNIDVDSTYYDHVNLVPEPTTLLVLGLGALLMRKRK